MPAQTPDPRSRATWAERTAALAAEPSFRALVADREPFVGPPLSRRERRAEQRVARRAARRAVRSAGGGRVGPRTLARGSAVAVAASLLVGGGLGTAGAAGHGARFTGISGVIAPFSADRATAAHGARLTAQVDGAERAERAEQLAVAGAALGAAAAVRPLTARLEAGDDVPARLDEAVGRLTALVRAGQPLDAARMQAEVPLPPAPPVVVTAPVAGATSLAGVAGDGVTLDDEDTGGQGALPPLEPLVPVRGAGTAAADTSRAAPGLDGVADLGLGTGEHDGTAGPPGNSPSPADDAIVAGGAPGTGSKVSARELADLAGEVFRLSMQVETRSTAARLDASVVRVGALAQLESTVSAADEAAAELARLRPLVPLTEEQRAALARRDDAGLTAGDDVLAGLTPGRARLRADVPAGVAALTARWANGRIPAGELCAVAFAPDHRLQCDAAAALARLNVEYRERFGTDLAVVSSYRELETQVSLRAEKPGLAAVPGTSNHGWGLAVDLGGIGGLGEFDTPGYLWLKEHAGDHGWHHPRTMEPGGGGPLEPWHWEFGTAR